MAGIGFGISVSGLTEVIANMERTEAQALIASITAVQETAQAILEDAQTNCPVRTGTLRDGLAIDMQTTATGASATIYDDVEYAEYVEFGTRYMAAEPFLGPAFQVYSSELGPLVGHLLNLG